MTARWERLCALTDAMLKSVSPQERDQILQRHLAAAMGPQGRLRLVSAMTGFLLDARRAAKMQADVPPPDGEADA